MKEKVNPHDDSSSDYVNYLLSYYCIPTLMQIKPASMINCDKNRINPGIFLKQLEEEIAGFGCNYEILYESTARMNLLIYERELLNRVILGKEQLHFLLLCGCEIKGDAVNEVISYFKNKLYDYHHPMKEQKRIDYPHEIGVILGYPVRDVAAFILHRGKNYLHCGDWKVYYDEEGARRVFERYHKLRQEAIRNLSLGHGVKDLINNI